MIEIRHLKHHNIPLPTLTLSAVSYPSASPARCKTHHEERSHGISTVTTRSRASGSLGKRFAEYINNQNQHSSQPTTAPTKRRTTIAIKQKQQRPKCPLIRFSNPSENRHANAPGHLSSQPRSMNLPFTPRHLLRQKPPSRSRGSGPDLVSMDTRAEERRELCACRGGWRGRGGRVDPRGYDGGRVD